MIPDSDPAFGHLPPGIYEATWDEVVERYGYNRHRKKLLEKLLLACRQFRNAGATKIYLDGSFITEKENPSDVDCAYEIDEIVVGKIDPTLVPKTKSDRAAAKKMYGGDFMEATILIEDILAFEGTFLDLLQRTTELQVKGIIRIPLVTIP